MENINKKEITQVRIEKNQVISSLIMQFSGAGFNAKRLASACMIYENMIKDEGCIKIMTLAGAMVPAGMRAIISDYIRSGYVDILVTTGANLTHDLIECLGSFHYPGNMNVPDKWLHDHEINRIYDVYLENKAYEKMEDFIKDLKFDKESSISEFLSTLGKELKNLNDERVKDSIIVACEEKKVPIYCPAFTDCGLAIQLLLNHPGLKLDTFQDLNSMIDRAWDFEKVGVFIIGGGVPKNFTFQALQFSPNSAKYAIQITMDRPETGGLSGATLQEAISWGKVNAEASHVTVVCDATIALPMILAYLKDTSPETK
ncbi:MAG: deoxyhypusine synthase family protein [Promethearchaeota archaeon]